MLLRSYFDFAMIIGNENYNLSYYYNNSPQIFPMINHFSSPLGQQKKSDITLHFFTCIRYS